MCKDIRVAEKFMELIEQAEAKEFVEALEFVEDEFVTNNLTQSTGGEFIADVYFKLRSIKNMFKEIQQLELKPA